MKITLTLVRATLILSAALGGTSALALNAEGYLNIQRQIEDGGPEATLHRAHLTRYLQGLSEAFASVYMSNNQTIPLLGNSHVCATSPGVFTPELMQVAIQQEIGTFRSPKVLEPAVARVPLGFHALMGLGALFPCK